MKKIGICANFGFDVVNPCGQNIKSQLILNELKKIYVDDIVYVDTNNWRKNPVKLIFNCINVGVKSRNIVILPAKNGVKYFIPIYMLLKMLLNRKLHYIVIGAWLTEILNENSFLLKLCRKIDYIYVETNTLLLKLNKIGLSRNLVLMPNFKAIEPIDKKSLNFNYTYPLKVCIFSRINKQKGVLDAISVVSKINDFYSKQLVLLDIYGLIDDDFVEDFNNMLKKNSDNVKYLGYINNTQAVEVLKEYYLLLFPTKYYTEGIPGTIIDALLSGVPILSSRWESYSDVIIDGFNGLTYEFGDTGDLYSKLDFMLKNMHLVLSMKVNCLKDSEKYISKIGIEKIIQNLI